MKIKLLIILYTFFALKSHAQKVFKGIKYDLQTGFIAASDTNTPFLLHANTFGQIPQKANFGFSNFGLTKEYDSLYTKTQKLKKFNFGYGLDFHANYGKVKQILLPEAYLKFRYGGFEFTGGRRKQIQGLTDSTLSSGAYVYSGNALPIPMLQLTTPNWIYLGKNKRFSFKTGLSHGWFGTQGIIENFYIHQKWLYFKINDKKQKVQLMGGINHQAQWGGYSEELKKIEREYASPTINGYLAPYPLYSYQFIVLPFLQKFVNMDPNKIPGYGRGLAVGNQLGSVDLCAIFNQNLKFYHQKPFDFARSLVNFNNIEDGIYGFAWQSKSPKSILQHITGEFIYTKSQGLYRFGKYQESNFGEFDNYFSHGQYQSWSYNSNILGTPYILLNPDKRTIYSNRVKVYYLVFSGYYKRINFLGKMSLSQNFGTYGNTLSLKRNSFLLNTNKEVFRKIRLNVSIAQDVGSLYPNSIGISFGINKTFIY
ncbi:hypothetical protein EGI22_15965 [Lacihabitans sp. LS3-19]|uniref:capsule assembly Wzi family protein n=1 Tax=Lacihabitans sp. LS3-19 TaxID=2487335 RepID=UPI0020CF4CFB|nr:capsule assembly Wzi family protein [Lacihabitans sp. LS3-19]MCP9769401.1 hypothetical protein [Lacihabitans sp. LS3-19]